MRFRLTPRSMTLMTLICYKFELSENFAGFRRFGSHQQQSCNPLNVLFNIIFLALIRRRFLRRGPSYTQCCRALTLASNRLSCIFDEHLIFSDQISSLSKSGCSHIRELSCIRPHLDSKTASTIATSVVHSKLDYYNSRLQSS